MKNFTRYRSLLARGAAVFAISFLLLAWTGCKQSKNTDSKVEQPTTMEEYTECTTTTTTSTGATSTTSSTTTSTETTTAVTMTTAEQTTQKIVSESIQATEPTQTSDLPITDYERTLLRNVVAREYGSDWVSVYDKACVVAVVINRMNSPLFPNTIEGVLTQPYQFSGYYACNYEWTNVTDSVRDAVDYYFAHPDEFGNWLYFYGDGTRNYFS